MLNFKKFLEMSDVMDNTASIEISKMDGFWYADFNVGGDAYRINFEKMSLTIGSNLLTENGIGITFKGPNSYLQTGKGQGPTIYRFVISAIKKLIQMVHPEGLTFKGATDEQEIMYHYFYEKFLKSYYTAVNEDTYINNDVLKHWEKTTDRRWAIVKDSMEKFNANHPIDQFRKEKEETRQALRVIRSYIGKVMWNTEVEQPFYVTEIMPTNQVKGYYIWNNRLYKASYLATRLQPVDQNRPDVQELYRLIQED